MRSCILLLFIALLSCKVHGKTQLLFANITETGKNAKVRATCVSDDYNDAITWITLSPAEFIKPVTGNESSLYIEFIWRNYGWDEEVAFNATFGPVMDYTWEMFPIVMTRSAPLTQNYKFEKLADINIRNSFEINLSFLGKSSAQIYLCSHRLIKRGICFIFIVGGWNGEGSVIRRCKEGASPINSENRLKGCENVVNKIDHKPLFSIDAWSQISIRYVNQQLEIIINDERLLSYQAENENEFNNFTKLFIHSNTESALWKYHEYSYYEARKPHINFINSNWFYMDSSHLCISFFAKFTKDITLQLYDVSHELIKTEYYKSDSNTQWNYKRFYSDVYEDAEYYLRITFSPIDKIAIRDIVNHLDCKQSKMNNFHFSTLEYNFDSADNIKCSSLRHKTTQFKISLPYQSTDVFTSDNQNQCNICSEFYNTTECPHRITCNKELCYCSPGNTGKYCEENCGRGKYGCNCASECANCNSNFCNPVNGECYFGCNDLKYIGPFCNETNLLVLTDIASVQTDCITNCTITIYDKELKYDGAREPKYYYTQLIHPNNTITQGQITLIKNNIIHFTNLTKETKYAYQIILCSSDKTSECYINDLTSFEFETTCEELHKDQIQIESMDKSTTIKVTSYNSNTNCLLDEYYLLIRDKVNNTVQYFKQLELSNTISSLNEFTNYTLQLTKNKTIIHNIVFTTDESVPKTVRNLTVNSSSPTKLTVVWTAPIPVLGIITNYIVTWMLLDKRDCVIDTKNLNIQSKIVTTTAIELDNLKPYSTYNITVSAVTKKGEGDIHSILGYIDATETVNLNTFNPKITTLDISIQISLDVDCENWNGPIYLNAYAICKSKWCEGEEMNRTKHMQYNDLITLDSLLPYTNYKLEVCIHRNQTDTCYYDNKLLSSFVRTQSSVPNQIPFAEVYSLSETSLSLRWSPPYPPTGILDSFLIKYHYISEKHNTSQTVNNYLSPCKIWPNMYCTTLTNLTTNKNYIISISGHNENISKYGLETIVNEITTLKVPEPPLNLQAFWDTSQILHLQWQHPNKTNGPFLGFQIKINGIVYHYNKPENFTYTYNTSFQCKANNHLAVISIQTVNSLYNSTFLTDQFKCPVLYASLSSNLWITNVDTNSITIWISSIENAEENSNLYVILLTTYLNNASDCERRIGRSSISSIPLQKDQICWVIKHYKQIEYKEIEGREITLSFPQMPEFNFDIEKYKVGMLIVNEYAGQVSNNWFKSENYIKQHSANKSLSIWQCLLICVACFLIVLLLLGFGIVLRKQKWKLKFYSRVRSTTEMDEFGH